MLQMTKRKEYEETTNSRVYNILHKDLHARCSFCAWHSTFWKGNNENDQWDSFHYYKNGLEMGWSEEFNHYPSWKLVSKNSKQWMKKKFKKICKNCSINHNIIYVEYIW